MADYAIGDVQGCYKSLVALLDKIQFDEAHDQLWFVGDLVNRGPDSLAVLRFVRSLKRKPYITLGNHDLHLLCEIFLPHKKNKLRAADDTLSEILQAPDKLALGHWLRQQPLLCYDEALNVVMTHAGIPPTWTLGEARQHATYLEKTLSGDNYLDFLSHMYGNTPNHLSHGLSTQDKLRVICNYLTRMRFCDTHGNLELTIKTTPDDAVADYYPWFELPERVTIDADIVFGHWAALKGVCNTPRVHAIDTGCVWGGTLTALRLQDKQRFSVS